MVRISTLIDGLDLNVAPVASGDADPEINDVFDDSRCVTEGSLFIARHDPATGDGLRFIQDAIDHGATAVLAAGDSIDDLPANVTWVQSDVVDQPLAGEIAERFWGRPSRKLQLIGITGTNGKTTTAFLTQHLLHQANVRCGMIGTVFVDDGAERHAAELTTPGAVDFSRLLARMVDNGCTAVVAEVSSHALHQGRVAALQFQTGVFTNLTGDHLDYHLTMDRYAAAKAMLFESLPDTGFAVINLGDTFADRVMRDCKAKVMGCSVTDQPCVDEVACSAEIMELAAAGSRTRLTGAWGSIDVTIPLVGRHNVTNLLQALAAASTVVSLSRDLRRSLEHCPAVPGRLEPVVTDDSNNQPTVIVDYAHTHDALENVLFALKPLTRGKLITVFGCGGDRDDSKRPKMASVACKHSSTIVITNDNPRTEDPNAIIADILKGVPVERRDDVTVEPDRAAAIVLAIQQAAPDDVVLLAGKGHEDYQIIGEQKRHFDDREQAVDALKTRNIEPLAK